MEQSHPANYNENVTPSAPDINGIYQEDFIHPETNGTHSGFVNAGVQDENNFNSGPPPQPQQPINARFMPHEPDPNDSYCGNFLINRRQASSVAGGLLLMFNSGLHIGWGIWHVLFFGVWSFFRSQSLIIVVIMAWPVGAFIGGFVGSIFAPMLWKKHLYYLSAAIMIVGNLLFIIWDEDGEALAVGRLLMGLAHGIAYVTLITHAGENASKKMRGTTMSIINCMLFSGIFVSVVITGTVRYESPIQPETISSKRIVAIVGVVLAIASIGCTIMKNVESVPYLLHSNNPEQAMENLKELRGSDHETLAVTLEMEELHLMVAQDKRDNWNMFTDDNAKPLGLMILMRLMVALTNNFLINYVAIILVGDMFFYINFSSFDVRLVPLIIVAPRLAMSIVQIFYADIVKRKIQMLVSSILAPIILIVIGIVYNFAPVNSLNQLRTVAIVIVVLWLLFQLSCSIGMDQMQDVYLSEAFSTAKKRWSLPIVVGVEHMLHILMIGMFFVGVTSNVHFNIIIFVSGGVVLVLAVVLVLILPETRNMSLKQAKDSFVHYSMRITSPFV